MRQSPALRPDAPRVAMLSVHTSPLDQPGTGDAGGMNVYVTDLARALADRGAQVEIFTRATASDQPDVVEADDGVLVRHVPAGPYEGLDKNELPGQLCAFTAGVLRTEAARTAGWYDVVHSHYWLSGQVGWLAADRWDVPLVHTMHTLAKVKNAALAPGDTPEPRGRIIGEEQVVGAADALVASTDAEAEDLIRLYGADPDAVHVVTPGVDLGIFRPDQGRDAARRTLGLPADRPIVLFAGRVQPLKAPDVLVRALARITAGADGVAGARGSAHAPLLVVLGGPSGDANAVTDLLGLARELGVAADVRVEPPVSRERLAAWYRAADLVAVPSRSESFGLVAAEAQACGTPVVAAAVGGLRTVVADGVTGALVPGHDPDDWARTLQGLLTDPARRALLGQAAAHQARRRGWDTAVENVLDVYARAAQARRGQRRARVPLSLAAPA